MAPVLRTGVKYLSSPEFRFAHEGRGYWLRRTPAFKLPSVRAGSAVPVMLVTAFGFDSNTLWAVQKGAWLVEVEVTGLGTKIGCK